MALQIILTFISALLCFLAFPPYHVFWLQLIALIPLIYLLNRFCTAKEGLLLHKKNIFCFFNIGFLYGIFYTGLTNLWVFKLVEFSTFLKIFILFIVYTILSSIFYGLITLISFLTRCTLLLFPFVWVFIEWLKSY